MAAEPGLARDELVIALWQAALSRPEDDRAAFLKEACAGDTALQAEVARRVEWEARLDGFLLAPVVPRERIDHPFVPGDAVLRGRFRILRLAGEGGMGVVYEAHDEKLNQRIALKCPRFEFRKRMSPEAVKALQVTHPNVCRVFEIHTEETLTGEVDFLTMEFIAGPTLAARLEAGVPHRWLQSAEGQEVARQVCAGLAAVHASGIVHRDLKASNVMLTRDAAGATRAVIMDFGIAQGADLFSSATRGCPAYLAPELWRGQPATKRSDLYALGVMLYEMVSGRPPFEEGSSWRERLHTRPTPPDVREPMRSAILRCLEPDPLRRFASAAEVQEALFRRRWLRRTLLGTAAAGAVWAGVRERFWPSSPVRLAVLPLVLPAGAGREEAALATGFLHDLSYRLRTLRGARRPFAVFPVAQAGSDGVKTARQARELFAGTHVIASRLEKSPAGWALRAELRTVNSDGPLRSWSSGKTGFASELFALEPVMVRETVESLALRAEARPGSLMGAVFADYLQGLNLVRADYENPGRALPYFERVVAAAPESALGHAGLAEALLLSAYVTGDRSLEGRAVAALGRAQQLDPELAHVHLMASRLNAANGQYERAIADSRRAAELDPSDVEPYIELGYVYGLLGRYAEADAAFAAGIRAQPSYYKPYLDAGVLSSERFDYASAARHWREAARLNPAHLRARVNLGQLYLRLGQVAEAEAQVRECLAIRRSRIVLELQATLMRYQHKPQEAVRLLEEAMRMPPADYKSWAGLAAAYREADRPADATRADRRGLADALEGLNANAREPDRISFCAYYHARLSEKDAARARAAQALAIADPPLGRVRRRLVLAYDALGDFDAAIRLLAGAPPALAKEFASGVDLSAALRRDLRFQRLIV